MQTIYYSTSNFVRHRGNIVDLSEYRRKLAQVEEGSCLRQVWEEEPEQPPEDAQVTQEFFAPRTRRSRIRLRRGMLLDACASMGVLVMTLTFTLRILAM